VAAGATVQEVNDELRGLRGQELEWARSQLEPVEALAARTFSKAS
jgi:hypothetical protein